VQNRLPWQHPLRNWIKRSGSRKFTQILFIWYKKIVRIGPADAEIYSVDLKKEEILEGKIYSPVGNLAQRAKNIQQLTSIAL